MKPKITLINICDNREKAWYFSRPGFDHSEFNMDKFGSMDIGFNSLCQLTFEITSSVIFRDLLLSIRPIHAWARSSRATPFDLEHMKISNEFGLQGEDALSEAYVRVCNGVPQDTARESLPMSMSTAFTASMDFRTVCGLVKTLKVLDEDLYNIYGRQFVREVRNIKGYRDNRVPNFLNQYSPSVNELENVSGMEVVGDMVCGGYNMKMPLMSQFIRNTHAYVKNGIFTAIKQNGYLKLGQMRQLDSIAVYFYISAQSYDNLMKMRSHWFADWADDMWGTMVGDYIEGMSVEEFWNWIPNGAGKEDPYEHDLKHRITLEDPNLPCPIALEDPMLIHRRIEKLGVNRIVAKYMELFTEGFVKDNPNNKLRLEYETNKKNKQDSARNVHH